MRNLCLIVLLLSATLVAAQNPYTDFKYSLKMSNLSSLSISRAWDSQGNLVGGRYLKMFQPIPSFMYKTKKGNFNEIALNHIAFNSTLGFSGNDASSAVGMSVTLAKQLVFCKSKETHWVPMLGLALAPTFNVQGARDNSNNFRRASELQVGVEALVIPRISWFSSKRFFMDFSLPIGIASFSLAHFRREPANAYSQSNVTNLYFNVLAPRIMAQVGFGVKL